MNNRNNLLVPATLIVVGAIIILVLSQCFPLVPPNAPITRAPTLSPTVTPTNEPTITATPTATRTIPVIHPPTVINPLPIPDTLTPTLAPTDTETPAPTLTNSPSITPTATRIPAGRDRTPLPPKPIIPSSGGDFDAVLPLGLFSLAGLVLTVCGAVMVRKGKDAR